MMSTLFKSKNITKKKTKQKLNVTYSLIALFCSPGNLSSQTGLITESKKGKIKCELIGYTSNTSITALETFNEYYECF